MQCTTPHFHSPFECSLALNFIGIWSPRVLIDIVGPFISSKKSGIRKIRRIHNFEKIRQVMRQNDSYFGTAAV